MDRDLPIHFFEEELIMKKIDLGLKAGTDPKQITDRLQYAPEVFEFYTAETDFTKDGLKRLAEAIEQVKDAGISQIILHHPMRYHGDFTELLTLEQKMPELYRFIEQSTLDLLQLAYDKELQVLVHGSYSRQTALFLAQFDSLEKATAYSFKRLDHFHELGKEHIMFENSISPIFYYGEPALDEQILEHDYRLAFDTSHCFIKWQGSEPKLLEALTRLRSKIVHYHLVDSLGEVHDSLELGKGKIDWNAVLPLLNEQATNIFEIVLQDQTDAKEQVASYEYLKQIEQNSKL